MSGIRLADLYGVSLDHFNSWRRLGLDEARALTQVERSGILSQQRRYESALREGRGETYAKVFSEGRDGPVPEPDPFDRTVQQFARQGMSEAAAKTAAIGRAPSESVARRELIEAFEFDQPRMDKQFTWLTESQAAIHRKYAHLSDEEMQVEIRRIERELEWAKSEVVRLEAVEARKSGRRPDHISLVEVDRGA